MRNKVAILGSTGSIGKTCLKIIAKDKKNFDLQLLTAQKNYKLLLKQAIILLLLVRTYYDMYIYVKFN